MRPEDNPRELSAAYPQPRKKKGNHRGHGGHRENLFVVRVLCGSPNVFSTRNLTLRPLDNLLKLLSLWAFPFSFLCVLCGLCGYPLLSNCLRLNRLDDPEIKQSYNGSCFSTRSWDAPNTRPTAPYRMHVFRGVASRFFQSGMSTSPVNSIFCRYDLRNHRLRRKFHRAVWVSCSRRLQ